MHVYGFLKAWRKNPKWSLSCCLACILPLLRLPGEIDNLVETNVINKRLLPGDIEMPTISAAVQDSGAIDFTLDEGEKEDSNLDQDNSCSDAKPPGSATSNVIDEEDQQSNDNQVKVKDDNGHESSAMHGERDISFNGDTRQNKGAVGVSSEEGVQDDGILGDGQHDSHTHTILRKTKRKRRPKTMQDSDSLDTPPPEGVKGDGSSGEVLQDSFTETGKEKYNVRTNATPVPGIGQLDVMPKEHDQGGGETRKVQHDTRQNDKKCHRGTQTELTTTMIMSDVFHTQL